MLDRTKNALRRRLYPDLYPVERTEEKALVDLIRTLRPQDCGIDLIRVGGGGDGGYLIPDDLEGIEYCFSPGVGAETSFEGALADRGIRSFLADASVDAPAIGRPEFVFDKKFVGAADRGEYFTLKTWKEKYLSGYASDLLLEMDIEGSEYEVILNAPECLLSQFRIAVIEFHLMDRLFDRFGFKVISSCFEKLLEFFYVAHIHPNNCSVVATAGTLEIPREMEFTFINRKRVGATKPRLEFPHKLDADNIPWLAPIALPRCWYALD
jgi:hypothetical protein